MASKTTDADTNATRFSDVADEQRRRLAPLRGYENLKLVSLEEATDPLVSIVKEIKHMVSIALADSDHIDSPLPRDQCASIILYSMQWIPKESSFYHVLNSTLRSPERDQILSPWLPFLKLFLTALAGLPTAEKQTVYRGVKMDLSDKYPTNSSNVVWWEFLSCTASITTLETAEFFGKSGTRTLFAIETHTGKEIHKFSTFPDETEILLLPGRELKVVGCLDMGNGVTMIQMKEIQGPFPHTVPVPPYIPEPTKSVVKLIYNCMTDNDIERTMHEALVEKNCTELSFEGGRISSKGAAIIVNALQDNKTLTSLNLNRNGIGAKGAKHLARALMENSTLTSLNLNWNGISAEGAQRLAQALMENSTLTSLNLYRNEIGAEGALYLAQALVKNSTLTSLNLNGNDIGDEGAQYLGLALKKNSVSGEPPNSHGHGTALSIFNTSTCLLSPHHRHSHRSI